MTFFINPVFNICLGGRESKTYGVDIDSGKVLYECSMSKCDNNSNNEPHGDVIVVQRQTQTVRAIEPRSGTERYSIITSYMIRLIKDNSIAFLNLQVVLNYLVVYCIFQMEFQCWPT